MEPDIGGDHNVVEEDEHEAWVEVGARTDKHSDK